MLYPGWPYAAKAVIQHNWTASEIFAYVTFNSRMNIKVKPTPADFECVFDGNIKTPSTTEWIDNHTLQLWFPTIGSRPSDIFVQFLAPTKNLVTVEGKQWEPWGPILSLDITT